VTAAVVCGVRCRTMSIALALVAGALFGAGLLVSGMTEPARVIGFLDVAHGWDPSLGFVMAGAVAVYAAGFRWIRRARTEPWFDGIFHLPTRRDVDPALLAGSALFGVGWGLGGLCPGPGLVAAASGSLTGLAFVASMIAGMLIARGVTRR
jgi:uncharacterized membrane protein YedE/YeeE